MNVASPSLVRYLQRVDLPTGDACECFTSGVAAYLASESWMQDQEERKVRHRPGQELLDIAAAPSRCAMDYAHFFAGAVVATDPNFGGTFSLAVVLAGAYRRIWPEEDPDGWLYGDWAAELGWCLAAAADGSGVSWEDNLPSHGMRYPYIESGDEKFFVAETPPC